MLAKIRGLRVVARTSSFQFKGTKDDIATIGRKLNVATVLEGSVRKAANRIRVSVQLVKVSDSSHLWSETYDRALDDIFAVQDDITQSVVKELRTTLLGEEADSDASGQAVAEVAKASKGRGTHPEAHRLYLLARHLVERRVEGRRRRDRISERRSNTRGSLAWAGLGGAYRRRRAWFDPMAEAYGQAGSVQRVIAGADLAEGVMGGQTSTTGTVRRVVSRALGRWECPRCTVGVLTRAQGRLQEAIGLFRRALEQDPLSAIAYANLGFALHAADRFAEAAEAYRKALELVPQMIGLHANLSLALSALGRGEEAVLEAMREPEGAFRLWAVAIVHQALGRRAESDEALRNLIEGYSETTACQIADVHGARGEVDAAFEWLERAYAQRDTGLTEMKVLPNLRPLHGDPRWGAFMKKMGFEE